MRTALTRHGFIGMAAILGNRGAAENANTYLSTHSAFLSDEERLTLWPHAAVACDTCSTRYVHRPEGDMADLNNLCRRCAVECATQLDSDYNLPEGCSDVERMRAMRGPLPGETAFSYRCENRRCQKSFRPWQVFGSSSPTRDPIRCRSCQSVARLMGKYVEPAP